MTSSPAIAPVNANTAAASRPFRLAYFVSHPIQYQAPLLRRIAQDPGIDLTVYYFADFSMRAFKDTGFGVSVTWDVPLLEGYRSEFLPNFGKKKPEQAGQPICHGIYQRLRDGKFDAVWVHGYSSLNMLHAIVAARLLGVPVLLRAEPWLGDRPRTASVEQLKKIFFAALKPLIRAVMPIGTLNDEYWQHYFGKDFPRFLFPYCVDNEFFQQHAVAASAHRSELQAELGLDPTRPVILFASKLQTRKHCGDLLEAYLQMYKHVEPRPYLLIIGDGEERAALESRMSLAGESGRGNVRMLGFRNQTELPRFFDLCSVFVLPSRHEPWGLVVNEAMNAGRAVIVTDEVGSARDLVQNGENGFVYPPRDINALSQALYNVLQTPETAVKLGANSLERINRWSFDEDLIGLHAACNYVRGRHNP